MADRRLVNDFGGSAQFIESIRRVAQEETEALRAGILKQLRDLAREDERINRIVVDSEMRLTLVEDQFPKNAKVATLAREGHIHEEDVGGGADCMFSDLISSCTAENGISEGQEFTSITGCPFQVWSNVTDWEADLQTRTAGTYVAYLCPGTYNEDVTFDGFAANFEIHLIGGGIGATVLGTTTGTPVTLSDSDPIYRFSNMTLRGAAAGESLASTVVNIKIHCDRVHMNRALEIDTSYGYFNHCEIIGGIQIPLAFAPDNLHFFGGVIGEAMTWNNNASMYGPFFHGVDFDAPSVNGSITFTGTGAVRDMHFGMCKLGGGAFLTVNASGGGYMEATFENCDMGEPGANGVVYVQDIGAAGNSGRFSVINCDFTEPGVDYPYLRFDDTPNNTPHLIIMGNRMPNTIVTQPIIATPGEGSIIGPNWPQPQGTSGLNEVEGPGIDHRWTLIDAGGSTHANIQHPQIKLGNADPNGDPGTGADQRPAPRGALFYDLTNEILWVNNSDGLDWVEVGGPGAGTSTTLNTGTFVVATDQDATLPNSRLLTEGTGIDIADGGAAGNITLSVDLSELTWIKEEGTALPTQRSSLDFKGSMLQAVDDGVDDTAIFGGYREYDCIVDSNQYNALATTVPVYTTLAAAVAAGHSSILFRSSTDAATTDTGTVTTGGSSTVITDSGKSWTVNQWVGAVVTFVTVTDTLITTEKRLVTSNTATTITMNGALGGSTTVGDTFSVSLGVVIGSGTSVNYILGDDPTLATLSCPLTISRDGVLISNMAFTDQDVVLNGVGATIQACRILAAADALLYGVGAGVIACAIVGASGRTCIKLFNSDQRVVSCRFQAGSTTHSIVEIAVTAAVRFSIVGNSWAGSTETGVFLGAGGAAISTGTINGNTFQIPLSTTGVIANASALGSPANLNISGNIFVYSTVNSGATETCIADIGRSVITGNLFIASNIASNTTLKWITTSASVTGVIVANNLYAHGSITSGSQLYGCEANAGGLIMSSNVFVAQASSTGNATGLNALALGYVFSGNEFVTITSTSMRNWIPVTNSGGTTAISGVSAIKGNGSGLVDIQVYRYT